MKDHTAIAAVDARTLVPVKDEAGGVVVYIGGRAAYYVLNGELFAALPEPSATTDDVAPPPTTVARGGELSDIEVDRLVSTS